MDDTPGTPHESPPGNSSIEKVQAKGAYIPLQYYVGFLEFLSRNSDHIRLLTYDDLPWKDDFDYKNNYPQEHRSWKGKVSNPPHGDTIHVLLQHDVDSRPERTLNLLRYEESLGTPSNVMIFNRRIDRKALKHEGILQYTNYDIDVPRLQDLEVQGFLIGYHSNVVEQAHWDLQDAQARFHEDVKALSQNFTIRYFSPHGGVPGPENRNNTDLIVPEDYTRSLRWVHNRYTPRFDGNYSDGGINNPKRDFRERDLRDFVATWKPGRRYRILVHPQYYDDRAQQANHLAVAAWYRNVFQEYRKHGKTGWEDVRLNL